MLKYDVTIDLNSYNREDDTQLTPWRNGSASDSRSEGCVFKSRRGQLSFLFFSIFLSVTIIITTKPKTFITDLFIMQYFKCGKRICNVRFYRYCFYCVFLLRFSNATLILDKLYKNKDTRIFIICVDNRKQQKRHLKGIKIDF